MGVEKSEVLVALLAQLEGEVEGRVDALGIELCRMEGGIRALESLHTGIERDVFERLRRDIDEGRIDQEKVAPHVSRYLQTCLHFTKHLIKQLGEQLPIQKGRVDEATNHVAVLRKKREAEEQKKAAVLAAVAAGSVQESPDGELEEAPVDKGPSRRPAGVRPAASLKARRQEGDQGPPEEANGPQSGAQAAPEGVGAQAADEPAPDTPKPRRKAAQRRPRRKAGGKDAG